MSIPATSQKDVFAAAPHDVRVTILKLRWMGMESAALQLMRSAVIATGLASSAITPALAQAVEPDANIDPVLPDPSPKAGPNFSPGLATSGIARPEQAEPTVPVTQAMLQGKAPGCAPTNPCAGVTPSQR